MRFSLGRGSGSGMADISASVYGCLGLAKSSGVEANLDDLADIHDRHPVADVGNHAQVVGDEQVGQPHLFLQILEQVQDLRLHGHIQR